MGAHKRRGTAILLKVALIWMFALGGVVSGAPRSAGGDGSREVLLDLLGGHEEIVFACRQEGRDGHWYANFGYYAGDEQRKAYAAHGRLCKLNVRTGKVTNLVDDPEGTVRDPQVHYDGRKIVFSYRKGESDSFHLYEINVDGTALRQLTDGGNIRQISSNSEHENTPWPLADGRILYQRWEYVDRSQVDYHHLWTTNPDGTGQMVFYGNMHPRTVMIDAKPIPGTEKVVAVFSPGHGRREHAGAITILSPKHGPDEKAAAQRISKKDNYRDPYPLAANQFLVAQERSLLLMDENDDSVKRMQSFLTVMPGETTSCVGCHEHRIKAPENRSSMGTLAALKREPSKVNPIEGIPDVFEFPRDIQPILDRHCVECHDYDNYAGGVILTGDRGPMFSHSYYTLTYLRQFVDGRDAPKSNLAPRSIGAAASPLMKKIVGEHYDVKVSPAEAKMIRFWIEGGAPYPGTYGALGSGMIGGYYENRQVNADFKWESTIAATKAIRRRCVSCHSGEKVIPVALSDERGVSFWRPDPDDPRLRMTRHLVFNLTRPEKSLMLLSPLAKQAGGYGFCKIDGEPVFADEKDADYQKILAMCRQGKDELEKIKRFDMPGFVPPAGYFSEMKRYGILPADLPEDTVIDVYATDRKYWQSLWHQPEQVPFSD